MNKPSGCAIRRGRPKDLAKRDAMLAAALEQFLERGPAGATMEAIAARAGVAKATLYASFPDRNSLLEAVIRKRSESMFCDDFLIEAGRHDLQAALETFGCRLLTFLVNPARAALMGLVVSAAGKHPELARRFFEAGPGRARGILVRVLAEGAKRRAIPIDDPIEAANALIGLWWGMLRTEVEFGYRKAPGPRQIRRHVARGVRLFMRIYESPPK